MILNTDNTHKVKTSDAQLEKDIENFLDARNIKYYKMGRAPLFVHFLMQNRDDYSEVMYEFAERLAYHASPRIKGGNFTRPPQR